MIYLCCLQFFFFCYQFLLWIVSIKKLHSLDNVICVGRGGWGIISNKEKKQEWTWNISGHQSWIILNLPSFYCSLLSAEEIISSKLHFRRNNWEIESQYNTRIKVNANNPPIYKAIPVCDVLHGFINFFYFFIIMILKLLW